MLTHDEAAHPADGGLGQRAQWSDPPGGRDLPGPVPVEHLDRSERQGVSLVEALWLAEGPLRRELQDDVAVDVRMGPQLVEHRVGGGLVALVEEAEPVELIAQLVEQQRCHHTRSDPGGFRRRG